MNKKKYLIIIICILIYVFIAAGQQRVPIEELDIISGIGYDIEKKNTDMIEYSMPLSTKVYKPSGISTNLVFKEQEQNLGELIQKMQKKMNKKLVQGQEQVILISEEYARYGIKTLIEDRLKNPAVNDMAYMAVCKGNAESYLKYSVKGYNNSSDYMAGLIEASVNYNFFADNYKLIDAFVRVGAEGRNLALPYIEITEEGIKITGMSIFKEDRMMVVVDDSNIKVLNILKNNNVKGTETLQNSTKEHIDFEGKTGKRKVKCYKNGEKYSFNIDLNVTGFVVNNEMYSKILTDINEKTEFEKAMAKHIEKQCYNFLKIMQNDYKIDCIDLGVEAAAKFGRQKKTDWNKVVCNADIKVNVKVKVDTQGRGDY